MNEGTLEADVNYLNFTGTTAADYHDKKHLVDLAKQHHIDTEKYFIIGLKIRIGETRGDKLAKPRITLIAVDMNTTKAGSIDFIRDYAVANNGTLPYKTFPIDVTLEEILVYFKRFELVLLNKQLNNIKKFHNTDYD